jgi:hypothetical protein
MGKKNKNNQVYSIRNVEFEPSIDKKNEIVSKTLNSIQKAFNNNKPAIISSHRLNYIGFIHEDNRKENLKLLKELLQKALTKWPDIEFMSSDELGMHMQKET